MNIDLALIKKHFLFVIVMFSFLCAPIFAISQDRQKGQNSEVLVSYDYASPESKTVIPFDKYFTFQVLHFNNQKIREIKVYESTFIQGVRTLKTDYINSSNQAVSTYDFIIKDFKTKHDTLVLYFPPIKPDKEFEIAVTRGLTAGNLDLAMQLNQAIAAGKTDAEQQPIFNKLVAGTKDPSFKLSVIKTKLLTDYQTKFTSDFQPFFNHLRTPANFPSVPFLTMPDLNLMDAGYVEKGIKFKWGYVPVRLITEKTLDDMFAGYLPADYTSSTKKTNDIDYKGRVDNLNKSISIMDTIYRNLNTFLFKENDPAFEAMRKALQTVINRLNLNSAFINKEIGDLTDKIQSDGDLQEVEVLIGDTQAKDITTMGTNIFTLDLGLATIGSWNTRKQFVLLPKFYYGVNIYFRPIDKNTRREKLPSGLVADKLNGPDYNIESQKSVWQHLSLTIGLTTGSYSTTDFDNLYSNTSLLIGGGYRFYRAFKVTAGAGFLRRSSNNPVITDKGVCVAPFLSFSADVDLVQTIKDVITPLWK